MIRNNLIEVPFRLLNDNASKYKITLLSVFMTNNDLICGNGITINGPAEYVGCFDMIQQKKSFVYDYRLTSNPNIQPNIIEGNNGDWKLRIYNYQSQIYKIFPCFFVFPVKSLTYQIPREIIQEFFIRKYYITIRCDRCKSININYENKSIVDNTKDKDKNNIFLYYPKYSENILLTAICNSSYDSFCEFTQSFANLGLTLLGYGSADGVNELNSQNPLSKLSNGVNRQLVYNKSAAKYSKNWVGYIQIIEKIIQPDSINLRIITHKN